jgi:chemotaxis protein histidine kinase CheA/ActR/RegA family two-component response regulator
MAVSKEKFLRLFLDEFRENLLAAENQLIVLKNDPGNVDALSTLLRTLHTIKGASRMLQFQRMERLVHGAETVFKGVREGRYAVDAKLARFFFAVADRLRGAADSVESGGEDEVADFERALEACERLAANEPVDLSIFGSISDEGRQAAGTGPVGPRAGAGSDQEAPKEAGRETPAASNDAVGLSDSSIRVDSSVIDRSISLVNSLTIRQLRLRSASTQLSSLERRLSDAYRGAQDLKALKRELAQLARSIRQYHGQYSDQLFEIEHATQELRDAVLGMRMLPLQAVLERFPRMVEETASALGKDVCLTISGDGARLDGTVLAKLSDPLIHLVRNAIDHGIEPPHRRKASGKPERGTIRIDCRAEGNRVAVTVEDDGAGLDFDAIRAKAASTWPEREEEIRAYADDELVRFIFMPGFSTRSAANELSGRGIGLDIVKTNVEAAKGQIRLERSESGGCRFTLLLPISASTMDGMFVESAGARFFVPASSIARTLLVQPTERFRLQQRDMACIDGVNVPIAELSTALQLEAADRALAPLPVLLVRGPSETVAIAVDRILGYDSLVYQPLPRALRGNRVAHGVVFDSNFDIIPILNTWAVLDRLRSVRAMDRLPRYAGQGAADRPSVLVVDDSTSTREIELSLLGLEGFDVVGAIDGVDALEKLRAAHFDLIVSDLNMPRMDGFKLLENVRGDPDLESIPVVLVTTVEDPESRRRAEALGVSRYILKSSFDQDDLAAAARELLAARGARR